MRIRNRWEQECGSDCILGLLLLGTQTGRKIASCIWCWTHSLEIRLSDMGYYKDCQQWEGNMQSMGRRILRSQGHIRIQVRGLGSIISCLKSQVKASTSKATRLLWTERYFQLNGHMKVCGLENSAWVLWISKTPISIEARLPTLRILTMRETNMTTMLTRL